MPIGGADQHFEDEFSMVASQLPVEKLYDENFNTRLSPEEETSFANWKQKYAPNDSGEDYDLRGAFQAGVIPDAESGHMPDTWKKPNHPTFSDESQYAIEAPDMAGFWAGPKHDIYVPPGKHYEKTFLQKLSETSIGKAVIELNKDIKSAVETGGEDIGAVTRTAATLATGGITTAPLREAGLGIFGGRMSKDAIFTAEKLEQIGYKPSEIKQVTGLERGVEGQWRKEFSDQKAVLKGDKLAEEEVGYLHEYLDHPEFFKAYPEAKNMVVYMDPNLMKDLNAFGSYLPRRKEYPQGAVAMLPGRPLDEMMDTILHELQHYVQDVEGLGPLHKRHLSPEFQDAVKKDALRRSPLLKDVMETVDAFGIKDPEQILRLLEAKGIDRKDAQDLIDYAEDRVYRTLSSEVEARNVEVRRRMSSSQQRGSLASKTEDVPREAQIYEDPMTGDILRDKDLLPDEPFLQKSGNPPKPPGTPANDNKPLQIPEDPYTQAGIDAAWNKMIKDSKKSNFKVIEGGDPTKLSPRQAAEHYEALYKSGNKKEAGKFEQEYSSNYSDAEKAKAFSKARLDIMKEGWGKPISQLESDVWAIEHTMGQYAKGKLDVRAIHQVLEERGWTLGPKGLRGKSGTLEVFDPAGNEHILNF